MEVLEGSFNHEKVSVGAFSVIVNTDRSFAALSMTAPAVSHVEDDSDIKVL